MSTILIHGHYRRSRAVPLVNVGHKGTSKQSKKTEKERERERETGTGGLFSVKKQRVCAYVRSDPQAGASGAVEDQS